MREEDKKIIDQHFASLSFSELKEKLEEAGLTQQNAAIKSTKTMIDVDYFLNWSYSNNKSAANVFAEYSWDLVA